MRVSDVQSGDTKTCEKLETTASHVGHKTPCNEVKQALSKPVIASGPQTVHDKGKFFFMWVSYK